VFDAPLDHRAKERPQILSLRGELILETGRVIAVAARLNDPVPHKALETIRQDVRRNTFGRFQKLGEAPLAAHQGVGAGLDDVRNWFDR